MILLIFFLITVDGSSVGVCPTQCDCDMDNGLNRASCVNQNIVSVGVGVPAEVQVYSLSHNAISELDNFCFKELGYKSIQILNLSYNQIFWVGLHAFFGLDQLLELNLSNNRLRYFPSDVFWYTPQLVSLDLSSNVFETIKNEPFVMHTKLQVLNLNNCRIKSLPDRVFSRLPNLKKLDLSENYLVTINLDVLRPMRKLNRLELRNDYWQCNPDFIATETWITSHDIAYQKICAKRSPKMFEKMISVVEVEKDPVEIENVWNITSDSNTTDVVPTPKTPLTPFQKFDRNFSALQAFVIGVEVGLAIGIVATYVWLRSVRSCTRLMNRRRSLRERRRMRRREGDMRNLLLWNPGIPRNLETPPIYRRQGLITDSDTVNTQGLPSREINMYADDGRSETPPPPYHECRLNL
ncbi:unnamed protein product [Leptidea sinapis]|uniref:LRRNT domain-containing protein n=1 Tax=Leptidea sinapis TaxID=189913 RepID=A0A5E4Q558_9NEOP|nr:unnamed protein product [Leptidea sinapis]